MSEHSPDRPRFKHPGSGSGRARPQLKGRQVVPEALDRIRALVAERPRRREWLIEHLHLIQDRYGCLALDHLAALAELMRLSLAEIYETATFYAHFDVLGDDQAAPPPITIRVCDGIACRLAGCEALIDALEDAARPPAGKAGAGAAAEMRVLRAPCMGGCDKAPAVALGHDQIAPADAETVIAAAGRHDAPTPALPAYTGYDDYLAAGGYALFGALRDGRRTADDIFDALDAASLRGLGGAGFPTGRKWRLVAAEPGPRYLAVNADEGEPGTFKDRHFLETDPHRMLEGALVAGLAVGVEASYIYVRDEYPAARRILAAEIARLEAAGLCPPGSIHIRRGAGAYICGEESAMLESIEGKRGLPRHKPPFPARHGLFARPTLINNVETLHWVRDIVERGPAWFAGHGRNGGKGIRTFSVSGRVRAPGVKIADSGITLNQLIDEHCGGMADGHRLKGFLPGGASGGILPAALADLPLDFGTLEAHGGLIGSAAVVVLGEGDDTAEVALNLMRFFADESCGKCTPCRVGCAKAVALMERPVWDRGLLEELSAAMVDASICGLGQAAPNGLLSVFRHFPDDVPGGG